MGAVTYPDADVQKLLAARFISVQVNIREPQPELRHLFRSAKPIWAPMFVVLSGRGSEVARWTGWLPPEEFRARLHMAHALDRLVGNEPEAAADALDIAASLTSIDEVHAEVMYWQGAVAYKREGFEALAKIWKELAVRHRGSRWATSAEVLDMKEKEDRRVKSEE